MKFLPTTNIWFPPLPPPPSTHSDPLPWVTSSFSIPSLASPRRTSVEHNRFDHIRNVNFQHTFMYENLYKNSCLNSKHKKFRKNKILFIRIATLEYFIDHFHISNI